MVKPTPAVRRATQALELLAAHPRQPFTLSEIARACGFNVTSTQAVLEALVAEGYVERNGRRKTYLLGPALLAVGEAARIRYAVADIARQELVLLADDLTAKCTATTVAGDSIVTLVDVGRPRSDTLDVDVGIRVPFRPPFGAVFVAWDQTGRAERWIARAGGTPGRAGRLRDAIGQIRERGFTASRESAARIQFGRALHRLAARHASTESDQEVLGLLDDLVETFIIHDFAPGQLHNVVSIAVPMFDRQSDNVELVINAEGFGRQLTTEDLYSLAERIRASAGVIARRVSGFEPEPPGRDD